MMAEFILNGRVTDAVDNGAASTWNVMERARDRWRATSPGLRPVTRFTRNFKTETSAGSPSGKEVAWSFDSPSALEGEERSWIPLENQPDNPDVVSVF
jgi:hypothetical protein